MIPKGLRHTVSRRLARCATSKFERVTGANLFAHFENDVRDFWQDQLFHGKSDRVGGTRSKEDDSVPDDTGRSTTEHGGRTNLVEAQHAKNLAKAIELLLEAAADGIVGGVTPSDARTAIEDDGITVAASDQFREDAVDLVRLILHDPIVDDLVTVLGKSHV